MASAEGSSLIGTLKRTRKTVRFFVQLARQCNVIAADDEFASHFAQSAKDIQLFLRSDSNSAN